MSNRNQNSGNSHAETMSWILKGGASLPKMHATQSMEKIVIKAILVATSVPRASATDDHENLPNIQILMRPAGYRTLMADDMCFSDVGCYGGEIHKLALKRSTLTQAGKWR